MPGVLLLPATGGVDVTVMMHLQHLSQQVGVDTAWLLSILQDLLQ